MPLMMVAFRSLEFVVTPERSYVLVGDQDQPRRIYTDGRAWPAEITPTYGGYSIGRWIDSDGGGRYDVLEVETRGFKGPRVYDSSGLPLHFDNQSIIKERIHLDKADPNLLHDEITVIDHALTQAVDRRQALRPRSRSAGGMVRIRLRRVQRAGVHRQGELFPERGRFPDAGAQEPGAARHPLLQADREVSSRAAREWCGEPPSGVARGARSAMLAARRTDSLEPRRGAWGGGDHSCRS